MIAALSTQLNKISGQLQEVRDQQEEQDRKFDRLETLLTEAKSENAELKTENAKLKAELSSVKDRVNHLEQRNRASCVRVFDLPIVGDSSDNATVEATLYSKLLLPILKGAVDAKLLAAVPPAADVIEVAHILPGQKSNKPILCRFKSLRIKQIVMTMKKDHAPRLGSKGDKPGAYCFPFFDDVTRDTFTFMRKLGGDERMHAAWYAVGTVKYWLRNSDQVCRVPSVYMDLEELLS